MILNAEKQKEFDEAATPLIKWLNENCHPHTAAMVDSTSAELTEGVYCFRTQEYIRD